MNGKNVAKGFVVLLILLAIGLGLYFGLSSAPATTATTATTTATASTGATVTVTATVTASPDSAPAAPAPNPYSAKTLSSKTQINTIQNQIIQNTNFGLQQIDLLVSSMIVNEDSIVITTSPDAKEETLTVSNLGLIFPTSKIANVSATRLQKLKKVIIDKVEFNIASEITYDPSYPWIEFEDLMIDKIFKKLINSAYKINFIDIKVVEDSERKIVNNTINFTSNEFADQTKLELGFKWKDANLVVDLGAFDSKTNKNYRILPPNNVTIVINNKIIMDAVYSSDAKEEQRTYKSMYTIKKISIKESFLPGVGIF